MGDFVENIDWLPIDYEYLEDSGGEYFIWNLHKPDQPDKLIKSIWKIVEVSHFYQTSPSLGWS